MRAIRLLINWMAILTLPVWGGTVMALVVVWDALKGCRESRAVTMGDRFLWED